MKRIGKIYVGIKRKRRKREKKNIRIRRKREKKKTRKRETNYMRDVRRKNEKGRASFWYKNSRRI